MSKPNITPEQICALRAGIEADRLAAEYVMGWRWYWWTAWDGAHKWRKLLSPDREPGPSYKPWSPADGDMPVWDFGPDLPAYSSSWDAMEQIVIQMRAKGWEWALFSIEAGLFVVNFRSRKGEVSGDVVESGAPLATLKAALLALCAEQEASNG